MPPAGFEPTIPGSERPKTHALDRAATGIGGRNVLNPYSLYPEGGENYEHNTRYNSPDMQLGDLEAN